MSARLTAIDIATRALRVIGEVPPHETPDGHVLARALEELDTVIADAVSYQQTWWFVRNQIPILLLANARDYAIDQIDGENVLAILDINILVSGQKRDIAILPLAEFDALQPQQGNGTPEYAVVRRTMSTTVLTIYPTPDQGYTLEVAVAVEAPDQSKATGNTGHGLRPNWQGWAIAATAAVIGAGPVRSLPIPEQRELERKAEKRLNMLLNYDNRPQRTSRRQTRAYFD